VPEFFIIKLIKQELKEEIHELIETGAFWVKYNSRINSIEGKLNFKIK